MVITLLYLILTYLLLLYTIQKKIYYIFGFTIEEISFYLDNIDISDYKISVFIILVLILILRANLGSNYNCLLYFFSLYLFFFLILISSKVEQNTSNI